MNSEDTDLEHLARISADGGRRISVNPKGFVENMEATFYCVVQGRPQKDGSKSPLVLIVLAKHLKNQRIDLMDGEPVLMPNARKAGDTMLFWSTNRDEALRHMPATPPDRVEPNAQSILADAQREAARILADARATSQAMLDQMAAMKAAMADMQPKPAPPEEPAVRKTVKGQADVGV